MTDLPEFPEDTPRAPRPPRRTDAADRDGGDARIPADADHEAVNSTVSEKITDEDAQLRERPIGLVIIVVAILLVGATVLGLALRALAGETTTAVGGDDAETVSGESATSDRGDGSTGLGLPDTVAAVPELRLDGLGVTPGVTSTAEWIGETPMVINIWATWCPPCVAEMPDLQRLHESAEGEVRVIGINTQDQAGAAEEFIEEHGLTFEMMSDPLGSFMSAANARAIPTTFLVSQDGEILYTHAGSIEAEELAALCREQFGVDVSL